MAIRAVAVSAGARALSGGVAVVLTLLLSGCPEAVTGPEKATRLLFTIQPTSTVAGLPITPAVQVTAHDARGNPAAGFTGTVTVALGTNPAGGTLSGSTTVAAVAGIATFPALRVDKSGSGYALTATASGLSGATSATFGITPGTPTQLAFTVQPSRTAAGASITPALQIVVRDAQGNTVPSFSLPCRSRCRMRWATPYPASPARCRSRSRPAPAAAGPPCSGPGRSPRSRGSPRSPTSASTRAGA